VACSCQGAPAEGELYVNVKGDGVPTRAMTKTEALASQKANGGYLRRA
jgi:hypothetical protein